MAKIQLHYRHIAAVLLILSCFVVFTIIVLYDVTSKKSATNITVTSPKEEVVTKRIRTASKDVLRKPQVPTSTPVYTPNNVVKDILSEQLELIHGNASDLDLLLSEQVDENPLLETLEKFVKSKQNKIVKISRDDFYVAAVIDFAPLLFGDVIGKVRWNADQYVSIIRECERYMVDIVVFPEMGLFQGTDDKEAILNVAPEIPPVEAAAVPCEDYKYGEILEKLSCAAKYSDMYVVATLMERYCSEQSTCSRRDLYLFLTTIVFDRNGTIIARYRKYNLHMDKFFPGVDEAREPELVVFNTDFNVTFGILSSFDLFFKHPAVTLIDEYGLTDIIVPSSLPTRLPFLAASSVPAGWSYVMNVNLLTSKSSDNLGAAGNNIFFGRRELTQTYMIEYSSSNIVIAPVPKLGKAFPYEYATQYLTLLPYGNTKKHYSYQIEHVMSSIKMESLYNRYNEQTRMFYFATPEFYCNITLEWEPNMMASGLPGYRMAAFNGLNNYTLASIDNYVEMCGLIQCSTSSDTICFLPPVFEDTAKVTIKSLHLTVASRMGINDIRIPITLKSDLTVWDPSYYEYENYIKVIDEQEYNIAEMHLRNPVSNLVAFGVYKLPEKINPANSYGLFDIILNTDMVFG